MADYIKREDVIARLRDLENKSFNGVYNGVVKAHKIVAEIPAADVRPVVHGKWFVSRTDRAWNDAEYPTHCKCNQCRREIPYLDRDAYCPASGADMREAQDG